MGLDKDTITNPTTPTTNQERRDLPSVARQSPYKPDRRLIDQLDKGWKPRFFRRKSSTNGQEEP